MGKLIVRKLTEDEFEVWDEFVTASPEGCIFARTFYLEAVQCDFYILGCFDKAGRLIGGLPIAEKSKGHASMPPITQTLGILLGDNSNMKYPYKLKREKEIITSLVEATEGFKTFNCNFHHNFTNWMPFMWKGYDSFIRYTYILSNIASEDLLWKKLTDNTRNAVNKARKNGIIIRRDLTIDDMYDMVQKTFERQNMKVHFTREFLRKFDDVLKKHDARNMYFAVDEQGRIHSAAYVICDNKAAYYLLGGGDPELRSSDAMYLCLYEAIKDAFSRVQVFDFEGSIVPGIESFVRSFGGEQTPYFQIMKDRTISGNLRSDIHKYAKLLLRR